MASVRTPDPHPDTRLVLIAMMVAASLTGCAQGALPGVATYDPSGSGGDAAQLTGMVRDDGDCLSIESPDIEPPANIATPVFPRSRVDRDGGVFVFDGARYGTGDTIELGGGEVPGDADVVRDADIPAGCEPPYFIVNQD